MKKILCAILALVMVLPLVACGTQSEPTADKQRETVETKTMKIAGTMSQAETDGEYMGTKKFAELVEKYTNGTIKCESDGRPDRVL